MGIWVAGPFWSTVGKGLSPNMVDWLTDCWEAGFKAEIGIHLLPGEMITV